MVRMFLEIPRFHALGILGMLLGSLLSLCIFCGCKVPPLGKLLLTDKLAGRIQAFPKIGIPCKVPKWFFVLSWREGVKGYFFQMSPRSSQVFQDGRMWFP
jgi:hypothetical protein